MGDVGLLRRAEGEREGRLSRRLRAGRGGERQGKEGPAAQAGVGRAMGDSAQARRAAAALAAPAVHEPRGREEEEARQVRGAAAVGLALLHSLLGFGWQRQLGGLPLAAARRADASARLREPAAGQQQPEPEVAHC